MDIPGGWIKGVRVSASEQFANSGRKNSLAGDSRPCAAVIETEGIPWRRQSYCSWPTTTPAIDSKGTRDFIAREDTLGI